MIRGRVNEGEGEREQKCDGNRNEKKNDEGIRKKKESDGHARAKNCNGKKNGNKHIKLWIYHQS